MKSFLLFLLACISLFPQSVPFPQDTIAYNEKFNNRMFPVYDFNGKIHLTYTGQVGTAGNTREIYYVKEENNGSFTTINLTNNSVDDNYSTLSIDQNGKLHLGYEARDGANLFQIYYMNNFGGNFGQPITITSGGLNKATPFSKVGPDSIVHFVFFTYTTGTDYAYYTKLDLRDSSVQLTPTPLVIAEAGGDFEASLDVDHNGYVHIVVKSGSSSSGILKYYNNTSGTLTEVQTGVTATVSSPKVLIDKSNKVHILYRNETELRFYMINNITGSFSTPAAVTPAGQRPSAQQVLAVDSLNRIYIVYQSSVATSGRGFYFVYLDNGAISDTFRVYDLSPEYVTRNSTAVIARGNGDMAIFYAPGGVRNSVVICDIFMKRGNLSNIPVELVSFTASASGHDVHLNWVTASEKNNRGFEIQRRNGEEWKAVAFIPGNGTTVQSSSYSYTDKSPAPGKYYYRLKQIDYNGQFEYSNELFIDLLPVYSYALEQNYPNPFNPSTKIRFAIPENSSGGRTTLKIYDVLGTEVGTIFSEESSGGSYEVEFDASGLSGGIYFYRLANSNFESVKKMILLK